MIFKGVPEAEREAAIREGDEPPCMPPHFLAREQEETGHPCPRREPGPDDFMTAQLAQLGARPESAHLFLSMLDAFDLPPRDRRLILRRVLRAYQDEAVKAALWPGSVEKR